MSPKVINSHGITMVIGSILIESKENLKGYRVAPYSHPAEQLPARNASPVKRIASPMHAT